MLDERDILTRPAPEPRTQVRYGPLPDHVADVWLPAADEPAPLVMMVHGGFWRAAYDRRHTRPMCAALAAAGCAVASIEYRRTGDGGGWTATFDDVALALDTVSGLVTATAPDRIDPERIAYAGHSAGGHLAAWAASRQNLPADSRWSRAGPDPALRGVACLAGVLDLTSAAGDRLGDGAVQALLGGDPADVPDRYAAADPIRLVPAGVPMTLVHGRDDDRVPPSFSRRYADRAGVCVDVIERADTGHFGVIDPASDAWPAVLAAVTGLLT